MRIKRLTSLAFYFSLTAFFACSQSGSPIAVTDEDSETVPTDPGSSSGSDAEIAVSDPEEPSTESQPTGEGGADSEPASGDSPSDDAPSATAEVDSPPAGDAPEKALSVVDSVLAGVSPAATSPEPDSGSESEPAAGQPDAPSGAPKESNAAEIAVDGGEAASASAGSSALPASSVFLATDFEGEDLSCWNGNRAANGVNRAGCGPYTSIGSAPFALTEGGIARSGRKAVAITYAKNEEAGGANVSLNSDSVNVRAYYYFEPGFDFGQGLKIGRVSSFNTAKQINDVDIILEVRSAKSSNQCGVTDMRDVGMFFNGAPKGSDWGNATATMAFERGRWYAVEYQVVMNAPGKSDGVVRLWVDGKLVAERTNLPIRGSLSASAKLNVVKIGGWYSNGANGNSCANPSQPAKLHMDDVAIAASYIGT